MDMSSDWREWPVEHPDEYGDYWCVDYHAYPGGYYYCIREWSGKWNKKADDLVYFKKASGTDVKRLVRGEVRDGWRLCATKGPILEGEYFYYNAETGAYGQGRYARPKDCASSKFVWTDSQGAIINPTHWKEVNMPDKSHIDGRSSIECIRVNQSTPFSMDNRDELMKEVDDLRQQVREIEDWITIHGRGHKDKPVESNYKGSHLDVMKDAGLYPFKDSEYDDLSTDGWYKWPDTEPTKEQIKKNDGRFCLYFESNDFVSVVDYINDHFDFNYLTNKPTHWSELPKLPGGTK
jgi:hypothetical protein